MPINGNAVFDFESQAGVMHLLASIRTSEIGAPQKSELRDLVFLYTNGGKDQTVRLALEQKIVAYRVTPAPRKISPQSTQTLPPQPTIGKFRVAPTFTPAPVAQSAPQQVPVSSIPVFSAQPAWTPHQATPEPVVQPAPVVEAPIPQQVPEPVPVVSAVPEPVTPVADVGEYLTRIREIKASVNEKVGNPVNLVDIDNEVGREYMGALLDAMKKLNSGSSAASAMKRLEESYASVLKALETHQTSGGTVNVVAVSPKTTPAVQEVNISVEETPVLQAEPVHRVAAVPTGEPFQPVPAYKPSEKDILPQPATVASPSWSHEEAAPSAAPAPAPAQPAGFASLADLKKPHTLEDLQATASLKASAISSGDPLFNKEVDDGLEQLLSEWSIFKKSGLFGTGPKGHEHPLFKKIAPLHIPLLLAGRFEGATQEIKQSITDYMNGWRYEQGIIYQQGETFEHYLRRVIRHILDLQKG
ncbi:MAG: hypothetical protein KBB78_00125 [Candidatus Pacebacteria bacterium]|nr:hypothetical protein [Candidatus Paceibacterota bacterium]